MKKGAPCRANKGGEVAQRIEGKGPPFEILLHGTPICNRIAQTLLVLSMVDSRNKGAAYERDICKKLNTFFSGCGFDITCKRNLDQYQTADLADIKIPYHAIECKAYKEGWWWRPEWWKQVKAACGNDIPVLIYKFNNKQSRVCIPMYAINPALPRDNDLTTVMTFDDWLFIMRKNWDYYERLTES